MPLPDALPRETAEDSSLFAGRYELGKFLRRGPYGTTFAARDTSEEGRPCEIQILDQARDLDELRELRARLTHLPSRHRQTLLLVGRGADNKLYCEWEALACEPLAARLGRARPLPTSHALEIVRQILELLTEAHGQGLAHGSLNPETVLLEAQQGWSEQRAFSSSVRLADFGLRTLGDDPLAGEFAKDGDPFADDRLAVIRILREMGPPHSPGIRALFARFERGDYPTAGFLLRAVEKLQHGGRSLRRRAWNIALPAAMVLLFAGLFLRERSVHATSRAALDEQLSRLTALLESQQRSQEQRESEHAALEQGLATERERTLRERMTLRWQELLQERGTAGLDELAAIARWFDDGRVKTALDGYAVALENNLLRRELVDPAGFEDFPNLSAWSTYIAGTPALAMSEAGARILALEHGRRMTSGDGMPEPLPPLIRARLPQDPGPVLAEILRRTSLAASFPGPHGVLRLYREGASSNWVTERIVGPRSRRVVERRVHDAGGKLLEERAIPLDEHASRAAREASLPWRQAAGWERVRISEKPAASVPLEALGVDTERYQNFRRAIEGRDLSVLRAQVAGAEGTSLLLSPELGELRREGNLERELVFADLLP